MKEQDVRQHVESFLKRTAREVVMPVDEAVVVAAAG